MAKQSVIKQQIYFHDYSLRHPHSTTLLIKCQTQTSFILGLSRTVPAADGKTIQSWKEHTFIPYLARLETTFPIMKRLFPFPTSSSTHSLLCLIAFLHKVGQPNHMKHHLHYFSVWLTASRQRENSSPKSFLNVNKFFTSQF